MCVQVVKLLYWYNGYRLSRRKKERKKERMNEKNERVKKQHNTNHNTIRFVFFFRRNQISTMRLATVFVLLLGK